MQKKPRGSASLKEAVYPAALLYRLTSMPAVLLNPNGTLYGMWPERALRPPQYRDEQALLENLLLLAAEDPLPAIQTSAALGNFFAVAIYREGRMAGTLLVGPSMTGEVNDSSAAALLAEFDGPITRKRELAAWYRRMPVMDYRLFAEYALAACYLLNGSRFTVHDLITTGRILSLPDESPVPRREEFLPRPEMRAAQEQLLACIRTGDKAELTRTLEDTIRWSAGPRAKLPLRAAKNQSIGLCTLALHTATEIGVDWQDAAVLGEYYLQCIEEMKTIDDVTAQTVRMLFRFCDQVVRFKTEGGSSLIRRARAYVAGHLHEPLTVAEIAAALSRSDGHLSTRFRQETGQTLSRYILTCKVDEAKRLLRESELPLSEIWGSLGFYDQSHFTRCFKTATGQTPRAYRDGWNQTGWRPRP